MELKQAERPFMKNLIPRFIHDNYRAGNFTGQFEAVAMFVDISGFTAMTEALMTHGNEGAEVMSALLNGIYEPAVRHVYQHGGFITHFSGDAFLALFPLPRNTRMARNFNVLKTKMLQITFCA